MNHIIRQQFLHIALNGSESEGLALQRSLPDLCQHALMPALEQVFARCTPANTHLTLERLDIDLGTLNLDRLEQDFAASVAQAVEKQLRDLPRPAQARSQNATDTVQYQSPQQALLAALLYFLNAGRLPWWFQLADGKNLEQTLLDAWQKTESVTQASANYTAIRITLKHATARQRLLLQFSPIFLETLLARLSPAHKQMLDGLLAMLKAAAAPPSAIKNLERPLWEQAFVAAATDQTPDASALLTAAWDSLPQAWQQSFQIDSLQPSAWVETFKKILAKQPIKPAEINPSEQKQASEARTNPPAETKPTSVIDSNNPAINSLTSAEINNGDQIAETLTQSIPESATIKDKTIASNTANADAIKPHNLKVSAEPAENLTDTTAQNQQSITKPGLTVTKDQPFTLDPAELSAGVYINCAGIVLLHPFLPRFFEALNIAAEDQLLQPERALCLLHYLATGHTVAPEYDLILPKILCNLPLETPVASEVGLTPAELEEAAALLDAVIRHWSALGNTSADGLRGTFFVRPGKISLKADGDCLLQVETKSYDILLDQLPWGISMIKLPWMQRMLWVEWCF